MNFVKIIKKAWKITWRMKNLWWLGLFILLTEIGPSSSIYYELPALPTSDDTAKAANSAWTSITSFFSSPLMATLGIVIVGIITILILFISYTSRAGLILAADKYAIERIDESPIAGKFFSKGRKYAWKVFIFNIILTIVFFVVLAAVSVPLLPLLASSGDTPTTLLLVGLVIIIAIVFIVFSIMIAMMQKLGERIIVLENKGSLQAFTGSVIMISSNIGNIVLTWLISLAASVGFGIGLFLTFFLAGLVCVMISALFYFALKTFGLIFAGIVCGIIVIILILAISSAFATFVSTFWTLCYKELGKSENQDEKPE